MKKKIYLAVTVLLLTLAGIYVAARMILWGGPVSFRSYVLLLGDLLCLLLLLFYVYLRVPIRLHRKIRDKWGTPGKWEWLEDIGIALWAVLCLIVTFAGIAWIWFENDIPSETWLTENLISVEEMEFPDRHWYSYWRPEGVLFRRETELAGEDYITYLTELMDKEENTHPEDAERTYYKKQSIPEAVAAYTPPVDLTEVIGDTTLMRLNRIFADVCKRKEDKIDPVRSKFGKIEKEEVTMSEKLVDIKAFMMEHEDFSFRELLWNNPSKVAVIVTFLVVLELIKTGFVEVKQECPEDDIFIRVVRDPELIEDITEE